jgi:GDP-mannose pyrophosphatase NudK
LNLSRPINMSVVTDSVTATSWAKFHQMKAVFLDEQGVEHCQERCFVDRGNAASVLAYCLEKQSVLLVEQYRLPAYFNDPRDAVLLEVCGGMLNHGLSPEETAEHEGREELGVPLTQIEWVFSCYTGSGSVTEKFDCFLARYSAEAVIPKTAGNVSEDERTVVREVTYAEVDQGIRSGDICDARTIALFYILMRALGVGMPARRT